jgi:opacity protein-like surface antigen
MERRPLGRSLSCAFAGLLAACVVAAPAIAQPGTTGSLVPRSGFFAGIGGGYQSVKFGTQDLYAIGTSEVTQAGVVVATGVAAGPASVRMPDESTAVPTVQGGYFRHFDDSDWLWGVKAGYTYVDTTATLDNVVMPQTGSFTILATNTTTPFVGNAIARSYRTTAEHQIALVPFLGRSFERSFVYAGGGATWTRTKTNIDGLVGFADIEGHHTDVSGAPQDFSASGWVVGATGIVGATYFLDASWFVDVAYSYTRSSTQTFNYSGAFTNANNPFGTTTGTLVGSSSGRVTTQGVMITISKVF